MIFVQSSEVQLSLMIATIFPFGILSEEFVNTIIALVLCSPLNAAVIRSPNEILLGKKK